MGFVHLHTHSHYTIGRGVCGVRDLVRRAARLGMPAIALTDTHTIAGYGELVDEAERQGIQPILGCELHVLPFEQTSWQNTTHPLTVLVRDELGYRHLLELLTHAHKAPPEASPHVSLSDLDRLSEGLVILTGPRESELAGCLAQNDSERTTRYIERLTQVADPDALFFEIIEYPSPAMRRVNDFIFQLGEFLKIPIVVTQDVYFLDPGDMTAYCAIEQQPRLLAPQWPLPDDQMPTRHFTTETEMRERFSFRPDIVDCSERIARMCTFRFPRSRSRVPLANLDRGQEPPSVLWHRVMQGATARYGSLTEQIKERLNREYADLHTREQTATGRCDMAEYLLFLQEAMAFVRQEGFSHGVGRGPVVTSVMAYCLGITDVDPIEYGLDFRTPRPEGGGLFPAVIELSHHGAQRLIEHLADRFGKMQVAALGHRVDWDRNRLFEQFCRWAGLPPARLADFPPDRVRMAARAEDLTPDMIGDAVATPLAERPTGSDLLGESRIPRGESLREHRTLADIVHRLHPCPRRYEAERTEFAAAKEPLSTIAPVIHETDEARYLQFDRDTVDRLGIPRLRFPPSGLINVIETAQHWVRNEDDADFAIDAVPLDDADTFRLLGLGLTNGIGPFHSISVKSLLRSRRPASIGELMEVYSIGKGRGDDGVDMPDRVDLIPDCLLGYRCAYLKVHHPVSFMAAMLTHSIGRSTSAQHRPRFQIILREARKMGFEVLGPDINLSVFEFAQERRKIRTGLMAIQGLGERIYREIDNARTGLSFESLEDFCRRTDPRLVTARLVQRLIKAGAFDRMEPNRTALLFEFERHLRNARPPSTRTERLAGADDPDEQLQLFSSEMFEEPDSGVGRPTPRADSPTPADIVQFEREAIGYAISHDMLDHYRQLTARMGAISPFEMHRHAVAEGRNPSRTVFVAGFVDHVEGDGPLVQEPGQAVLDLEGHVARVPPGMEKTTERISSARSPLLIEGIVRPRGKNESFLVVRRMHLLEEVAEIARNVAILRLNLAGENHKTIALIRAAIRKYKGNTRIESVGISGLSAWKLRGLANASVFFCPPLYRDLCRILDPSRIIPFDRDGKPVDVHY